MEGEGWGPKTPSENKTSVKVGMEKMMIMRVTVTIIIIIITVVILIIIMMQVYGSEKIDTSIIIIIMITIMIIIILIIIMMQVYGSEKMDWRGECFLMAGVFGFALVGSNPLSMCRNICLFLWSEYCDTSNNHQDDEIIMILIKFGRCVSFLNFFLKGVSLS